MTTTPLSPTPKNVNFLQPNRFTFMMPDMPAVTFFTQKIRLPAMSTSSVPMQNPFSTTARHGDKLDFGNLEITFLLDEEMQAWREMYTWLTSITFPDSFDQYGNIGGVKNKPALYKDIILTLNTNANVPYMRILFRNCTPMSLSEIEFTTTENAETVMTCSATFDFDGYDFTVL